jgi:hypothetical protein
MLSIVGKHVPLSQEGWMFYQNERFEGILDGHDTISGYGAKTAIRELKEYFMIWL